jgi:STE24 endopeptidase
MSSESLFNIIICLVIFNFIIGEILKYLNNQWRKKPIPELLKDVYSKEKYNQYQEYKKETYRFSVITSSFSLLLTLLMLYGGFTIVDEWIRELISNEILISILFFILVGLASDLVSTPFDLYETFVIEEKYGFNTTTIRIYILDKLKSYFLSVIIGFPVLFLIIWLYQKFGADFWWLAWIVISFLSLAMSLLYSNLIVPLFNKQTPLEEGELKGRIKELGINTGFKLDKIFVIDGSKRSTRANAYFTGFGSKKRIVLYDTLIKTQSVDQIIAVLAHEIGHYKHKHTVKGLITSILQTGLLLFLFSLIVKSPQVYEALGTDYGFHIGMIVFVILYSPLSFIISIFMNYISRVYEFQADAYATKTTYASWLIVALKLLTSNNMSDLTPHPWYVIAYYSHPPLLRRIEEMKKNESSVL